MATKKAPTGDRRPRTEQTVKRSLEPSAPGEAPLRSIARSFAVLDYLALSPSRVIDVTRHFNLTWATAHRTIMQLEKEQLVYRDPESNRYHIGARLWHVGSAYLANHRVLKAAASYTADLELQKDFAVQVVERVGWQTVAIYSHQRAEEDITKAHYGYHFPLHCASKGLVLLADESSAFIDTYLKRDLERYTALTITDPDKLRELLAQVRHDGVSFTTGDIQLFTASIAAPIRDASGKTIACLCFVFRKGLAPRRIDDLTEKLLRTAQAISIDLGWHPGQPAIAQRRSS